MPRRLPILQNRPYGPRCSQDSSWFPTINQWSDETCNAPKHSSAQDFCLLHSPTKCNEEVRGHISIGDYLYGTKEAPSLFCMFYCGKILGASVLFPCTSTTGGSSLWVIMAKKRGHHGAQKLPHGTMWWQHMHRDLLSRLQGRQWSCWFG